MLLIAVVMAIPLSAHAVLKKAEPAAGTLVAGPALTIGLQFNTRIDARRSRISLVTPDHQTMVLSLGPQPSPDSLTAPVKGLLAGEYKVRWQVLAADGHISRGEYSFRIK